MKTDFLDTSYLLALEIANDQYHESAVEHWRKINAAGLPSLVTTTAVFGEVVTYLNSRRLHAKAVEVGDGLLASPLVRVWHVDEELFQDAWQLLRTQQDKQYSHTDCVSFVLMRRLGVTTAFAFDHHFQQAGFNVEP